MTRLGKIEETKDILKPQTLSPDGRENPFVSAAADTKDWKEQRD